jgi:hypothetical protein
MTARYSIFLLALGFNGGIKACVVVNGIVVLLGWCCDKIKVLCWEGEWREFWIILSFLFYKVHIIQCEPSSHFR